MESRFKTNDGRTFPVEISSNYYFDDKEFMASLCRDISERKRAEDELRESEEHYRALVETSPDAIIVHSYGLFLHANPAALWLCGADTFDKLQERNAFDLIYHPCVV